MNTDKPSPLVSISNKISNVGTKTGICYALIALGAVGLNCWGQLYPAANTTLNQTLQVTAVVIVVGSFIIYICALIVSASYASRTQMSYKTFLQALGAQPQQVSQAKKGLPVILEYIPKSYLLRRSRAFRGTFGNRDFDGIICDLKDRTVKDRRSADDFGQYDYEYAVLHFTLSHSFPYVMINPKVDTDFADLGVIGEVVGGISLRTEGNFSSRYNVTLVKGDQISTLSLLTPDFMAELLDSGSSAAIEFSGHDLYIIQSGIFLPRAAQEPLSSLQSAVRTVLKHLDDIEDTWLASSTRHEVAQMNSRTTKLRRKSQ